MRQRSEEVENPLWLIKLFLEEYTVSLPILFVVGTPADVSPERQKMKWNPPLVREGTDRTGSCSGLSLEQTPEGVDEKREAEPQSLQAKCLAGQNQNKTKQQKPLFISAYD